MKTVDATSRRSLISYVENFVRDAAGEQFNPHVTIGVGTEKYLNEMLARRRSRRSHSRQRALRSISSAALARLGKNQGGDVVALGSREQSQAITATGVDGKCLRKVALDSFAAP